MNISLPIYVENVRAGGAPAVYRARPLFFAGPVVRGERLESLLTRLMQDLGKELTELGRLGRHDALAAYTFYPRLVQERIELTLILRRCTARCRFLFVSFRQFGRRIAFSPNLPDVWFDLARGEHLRDRAAEVFTKHFRDREREDDEVHPERFSLSGSAYITQLELSIHPPARPPEPPKHHFLMLGSEQPAGGAAELRRVGRCLDWQYPDDLDPVALRHAESAELTRLLNERDGRPVLLLGPRQVGKTALVHEYVRREVAGRASVFADKRNVWLLAPARLISGMCYVGQWEDRLLAILKEARKRDHLLYFEDLLGLFLAGQTGSSSLSVADVLRPYLERRRVRVLAEITPEAFGVLREKDRAFADLFHVLPVAEPNEADTLRILLAVRRHLEARHRCHFDLDVLPTVIDLQRRFRRDLAFPGKAAALLRQLAVKHANSAGKPSWPGDETDAQQVGGGSSVVSRDAVLREFHAQTGLVVTFLDRQARLDRKDVLDALAQRVVGQEAAVRAGADVIGIAKARLNDPERPLSAFLFLGPTGVGKTECAKALAAYLFGDAERLLRFDLNEYAAAGAAARLVGTFRQPEGLLTGAIRRQPFAVVLFDEVEKAHPEVFDLLLQVLGEGRLTDALGRTADFGNALIVLTSNLGVRESESQLGFRQDEAARDALFVQAAERFFRPEFFNRLDRVIPFRRLTRGEVGAIAIRLIQEVFGREGLAQRKCMLAAEPAALERIVDQGFDPVLGARALKRAVERELTQPVASQLAKLPPGGLTLVRVYPGPDALQVQVQALEESVPLRQPADYHHDSHELLRRVRAALQRIEGLLAQLRPQGAVTLGQVSADHYRYFALREQAEAVREECRELEQRMEASGYLGARPPAYPHPDWTRKGDKRFRLIRDHDFRHSGIFLRELAAALDINEYLRELADLSAAAPAEASAFETLLRQVALLDLIAGCVERPGPQRVLFWIRNVCPGPHDGAERTLLVALTPAFRQLGLECKRLSIDHLAEPSRAGCFLLAQGVHAMALARQERGVHLFSPPHGPLQPVQVDVLPLPDGEDAETAAREWAARRETWLTDLAAGRTTITADPFPPGPVLRVVRGEDTVFDLRSGLCGSMKEFTTFLRASLPLPPEILE